MSPSVPGRTTQTQPHPSPNYVKGMEASSMISESKAMRHILAVLVLSLFITGSVNAADTSQTLWTSGKPQAVLIPPHLNGPMASVVESTINGYLQEAFGWMLPVHREADGPGLFIVVGDESNNSVLGSLRGHGLKLDRTDLGPEGFRILTHEAGERRFIIVTANTPVGLKHGCQELVFFRLAATHERCAVDWPLDVRMKPAFAYRGVYMLPCWSAYDSLDSWKRVLRFHSELTLNRNWFWLAGFNLLESYGGEYQKTDLANADNVRSLVELCRAEGMKFYIGGGWFTWHHQQHAAGSMERGIQYYLDMLDRLPGVEGIYLEPAGEGRDTDEKTWRERTQAFQRMARTIWERRPEFEFAIAIGEFNSKAYRQVVHEIEDRRLFWWWCWGDPVRDKALSEHPLILRWHTIVQMSDYHGYTQPPQPREAALTGFATSYDPGQGFGNPWNGWGAMGVNQPRNFDPRTLPFFSHQYLFRERCWNINLADEEFASRLSRRLFDADMPPDAIHKHLTLADLCPKPLKADAKVIDAIDEFVARFAEKGTPRNRDTLLRMRQAIDGMRRHRAKQAETR